MIEQKKIQRMNKKGILGLETVRGFMLIVLTLAVVAIAMFIALNSIISNNNSLNSVSTTGQTYTNATIHLNNSAAAIPSPLVGLRNVAQTNVIVTNATSGVTVAATNYTVSGATIIAAGFGTYNNTNVNISATYSYDRDGNAVNVQNNVTYGVTQFFTNMPTMFSVLGAVIIVLVISLILYAVRRFSEDRGGSVI